MTKVDVLGFKTTDSKQQQSITFPAIVRMFNERAKPDSSSSLSSSGTIPNPSNTSNSSSSLSLRPSRGFSAPSAQPTLTVIAEKELDKEEKTRITEEDRALLDSILNSKKDGDKPFD